MITAIKVFIEKPGEDFKYGYTLADWLRDTQVDKMKKLVNELQGEVYQLRGQLNILQRDFDSMVAHD